MLPRVTVAMRIGDSISDYYLGLSFMGFKRRRLVAKGCSMGCSLF